MSLVRAAWAWDEDKKHEQNEAAVELQAKARMKTTAPSSITSLLVSNRLSMS